MSDCQHKRIVEDHRDPDGSIWGRCEDCGDNSFPIRDMFFERLQASNPYRCSLQRMAEDGLSYPEALSAALNSISEG